MQSAPGHTRSSSFFSFFTSKQSDSAGHYRTVSQQEMRQAVPQPQGSPQPPSQQQAPPQNPPPTQQLHPEIRSVVQLNHAHAHKVYFSGPLLRKLEHNTDGQKPIKDEGWTEIWAQLGGTTLSVWDMKEIEAASKQGREVPPSYINITDAVRNFVLLVSLMYFLCFLPAYPYCGSGHGPCYSCIPCQAVA